MIIQIIRNVENFLEMDKWKWFLEKLYKCVELFKEFVVKLKLFRIKFIFVEWNIIIVIIVKKRLKDLWWETTLSEKALIIR